MTSVIDFASNRKSALLRGFMKGLGAPYILYGSFESFASIPSVDPIRPTTGSDGLAGDWTRIGRDVRVAIRQYGQETSNPK